MATTQEKIKAQAAYQHKHQCPHFAPSDGICWRCGKQIYDLITVEDAATQLITGCPHCNRSYCD